MLSIVKVLCWLHYSLENFCFRPECYLVCFAVTFDCQKLVFNVAFRSPIVNDLVFNNCSYLNNELYFNLFILKRCKNYLYNIEYIK